MIDRRGADNIDVVHKCVDRLSYVTREAGDLKRSGLECSATQARIVGRQCKHQITVDEMIDTAGADHDADVVHGIYAQCRTAEVVLENRLVRSFVEQFEIHRDGVVAVGEEADRNPKVGADVRYDVRTAEARITLQCEVGADTDDPVFRGCLGDLDDALSIACGGEVHRTAFDRCAGTRIAIFYPALRIKAAAVEGVEQFPRRCCCRDRNDDAGSNLREADGAGDVRFVAIDDIDEGKEEQVVRALAARCRPEFLYR